MQFPFAFYKNWSETYTIQNLPFKPRLNIHFSDFKVHACGDAPVGLTRNMAPPRPQKADGRPARGRKEGRAPSSRQHLLPRAFSAVPMDTICLLCSKMWLVSVLMEGRYLLLEPSSAWGSNPPKKAAAPPARG